MSIIHPTPACMSLENKVVLTVGTTLKYTPLNIKHTTVYPVIKYKTFNKHYIDITASKWFISDSNKRFDSGCSLSAITLDRPSCSSCRFLLKQKNLVNVVRPGEPETVYKDLICCVQIVKQALEMIKFT